MIDDLTTQAVLNSTLQRNGFYPHVRAYCDIAGHPFLLFPDGRMGLGPSLETMRSMIDAAHDVRALWTAFDNEHLLAETRLSQHR